MDNMDDGATNVAMTVVERTKLTGLDTGNKLTVTATEKSDIGTISTKVNTEEAQDSVGLILTDTNTIDLTYDDVTPKITADVLSQNSSTANISDNASGLKVDVVTNSSKQKIDIGKGGTVVGTRKELNLIEGTNVTLTLTDDAVNDKIDVTINSTAVAGAIDVQKDDADVVTSMTTLNFEGSVSVTDEGSNKATVTIGSGADINAKVSSADTTTGYLEDKVIGTTDKVVLTKNNTGANENIQISLGTDVFDKVTNNSDNITEGSTNLFMTSTEKVLVTNITTTFDTETKVIDTFAHASNNSSVYDYELNDGTNYRVGRIKVLTNGTLVYPSDTVEIEIGDTSDVDFSTSINGVNAELKAVSSSDGWTIVFTKRLL